MIFGVNTTRDISKLSSNFTRLKARELIVYNNFQISLVVFIPNITTNRAITYKNLPHFINNTCNLINFVSMTIGKL